MCGSLDTLHKFLVVVSRLLTLSDMHSFTLLCLELILEKKKAHNRKISRRLLMSRNIIPFFIPIGLLFTNAALFTKEDNFDSCPELAQHWQNHQISDSGHLFAEIPAQAPEVDDLSLNFK